ncbi:antirestriction protein ArdR [Pseudomonas sp. 21LCFQ02]|uniref:antirestriction protein ArdR n=1 Tax=Pseudomonas sp. 21LCFQ02 TaxID=2957505 RepID=UPI00209BB29C|nr:antirestriction protein ArdR [Pseudomonas sp. 21LCFQ02]MCO8166220.1 antirestriction protein ArdR [Pseudomonas sp. 21LCFQ02]
MNISIDSLRISAASWRACNPEHSGGVVLLWQGVVYGWKDSLRDPGDERPGAFAVAEDGQIYVAEGGEKSNGAQRWSAVS